MEEKDVLSQEMPEDEIRFENVLLRQGTLLKRQVNWAKALGPLMAPERATLVWQGKRWFSSCLSSWGRGAH